MVEYFNKQKSGLILSRRQITAACSLMPFYELWFLLQ